MSVMHRIPGALVTWVTSGCSTLHGTYVLYGAEEPVG
jgi:hypothetical protein